MALPGRRVELAPRITTLLGQPAVQPYIWGLLANLREGRENLLPDLELHADTGEEQAIILLAVWGTASPGVQLAARRAAARLLRWQTGTPREFLSSGMWHQGARLLVALLGAAGPLAAVVPADLQDPQDGSGPGQPDEAAILAAGDPGQLAAACAGKLAAIASDSVDSIVSRHTPSRPCGCCCRTCRRTCAPASPGTWRGCTRTRGCQSRTCGTCSPCGR